MSLEVFQGSPYFNARGAPSSWSDLPCGAPPIMIVNEKEFRKAS
jgi:hypothetical protein